VINPDKNSKPQEAQMNIVVLTKYIPNNFEETIKMLPKNSEPILLNQVFGKIVSLGCIHPGNVQVFPP
jgi:hypothetical protein